MFHYDSEKDEYSCPADQRLQFRSMLNENGRWTRYYVTPACRTCPLKSKCTRGEQRRISRWLHDDVMDRMRERVRNRPDIMKIRRELVEHPFGTLKRWWDQGFLLTRGLENVRTEGAFSVMAYNMKRAINILGVRRLILALN